MMLKGLKMMYYNSTYAYKLGGGRGGAKGTTEIMWFSAKTLTIRATTLERKQCKIMLFA